MANEKAQVGYTNPKLNDFLDTVISEQSLATHLRRINYILSLTIMRLDETKNPINPEWAENGFFWINELAEILDPVLEKED
ncbi:hypothetical protein [Flavobacterium sandaracinum]|uniref:Uncharacterized protein n=1 Tax=Flavobacterium sandaracinum TaxID=2541733 RepID=A0A4R5CRR0_9FLAO|nr:hypothetical protein [Flavobacterium sandaracinum]TDE01521.1 hypothetical protein E0F91_14295 [Flavobacterium sandaracinum]